MFQERKGENELPNICKEEVIYEWKLKRLTNDFKFVYIIIYNYIIKYYILYIISTYIYIFRRYRIETISNLH